MGSRNFLLKLVKSSILYPCLMMRTQPYLAAKELTDSYLTIKNLTSKQAASSEESNKMGYIVCVCSRDWFWEEEALCYYYTLGSCVGPGPSMRPAGGGMVEKSGEYLLQRFYHANMDRYCVLALCCVSWCCVCGVRCEVVMKLLIHMKNTNIKNRY